jgi:hypothetical protein
MLRIIRSKEIAKPQWLQDPSEINWDNLSNTRSKPAGILGIEIGNI